MKKLSKVKKTFNNFTSTKHKKKNTKTYISENNITTFEQLLQKIAKKIHDINFKKNCHYSYITLYITS